MTKTTFQFQPSPDADHGHMVRVLINRKDNKDFRLEPGVNQFTVESNYDPTDPSKSDHVMVFVAAIHHRDGKEVFSKAKMYEFITTPECLPTPPGELSMIKVAPDLPQVAAQIDHVTRVMVSGFAELYDGSVGIVNRVVGGGSNSSFPNGIVATFPPNTVRAGGSQIKTVRLYPGDPSIQATILPPDGSQITLGQYLQDKTPTE